MLLVVECNADKALVSVLLRLTRKEILHAGNKAAVVKHAATWPDCVGLVDQDPGSCLPALFGSFVRVFPGGRLEKDELPPDVELYRHPQSASCLVVLAPRLEEWVLRVARVSSVSPGEFGLPADPNKLHRTVNSRLDKWQALMLKLTATPEFAALATILRAADLKPDGSRDSAHTKT